MTLMNADKSNGQICWIWPFRFSSKLRGQLDRVFVAARRLASISRPAADCERAHRVPSGGSVCAAEDAGRSTADGDDADTLAHCRCAARLRFLGLGVMAIVFVSHCAAMIWITAKTPEVLGQIFPDGAEYWVESRHWIVTGQNPEYELKSWVPAHFLLAISGAVLTYASLGICADLGRPVSGRPDECLRRKPW